MGVPRTGYLWASVAVQPPAPLGHIILFLSRVFPMYPLNFWMMRHLLWFELKTFIIELCFKCLVLSWHHSFEALDPLVAWLENTGHWGRSENPAGSIHAFCPVLLSVSGTVTCISCNGPSCSRAAMVTPQDRQDSLQPLVTGNLSSQKLFLSGVLLQWWESN